MRPPLLIPLGLLGLLAPPASPAEGAPAPGAAESALAGTPRVHLLRGRATVLEASGTTVLAEDGDPLRLTGPAHVQLSADCAVELRWSGRASLRLVGPGALEWMPARGPAAWQEDPDFVGPPASDAARSARSRSALCRLIEFRRAEVEVRRGMLELQLVAPDRRLEAGRSAFALEPLPDGALRVVHRAGLPVTVEALPPAAVPETARVGPAVTRILPAPRRAAVKG